MNTKLDTHSMPFTRHLRLLAGSALLALSIPVMAAGTDDAQLVERGHQIALAADCVACHTAKPSQPFAGGLGISTPIGLIYASNITPSKTHGIGNYTLEQFSKAVRDGVRADGQNLYPAMPYTSYAHMTDDDVAALYAYFQKGVKPVDTPTPETSLPFPFTLRASMLVWNKLFLDTKRFTPNPQQSAEWNRGAYLVDALAHCSTCHTPRNVFMAEDHGKWLGGSSLGAWYAPNITSDKQAGIGGWTDEQLFNYLRTGHGGSFAQAAGPMAEAIDHSLSKLPESDLKAMVSYLKTVPPISEGKLSAATNGHGQPLTTESDFRGKPVPVDRNTMKGSQLYDAYCASCHQMAGTGSYTGALPSLVHNTALGHGNADNLVMVVLGGIHRGEHGQNMTMPAFGKMLTNEQISTLSNYLFQHFGNKEVSITPQRVAELRSGGSSNMLLLARLPIALAILVVMGLAWFIWERRQRR